MSKEIKKREKRLVAPGDQILEILGGLCTEFYQVGRMKGLRKNFTRWGGDVWDTSLHCGQAPDRKNKTHVFHKNNLGPSGGLYVRTPVPR